MSHTQPINKKTHRPLTISISNTKVITLADDTNQVCEKLYQEGLALFNDNKIELAKQKFQQVLSKKLEHINAVGKLANIYYNEGDRDAAVALFDKALANAPQNATLWHNKGVLLAYLNRPQDAKKCYYQAIEIAPNYVDALRNLAIQEKHDFNRSEAIKYFERLIEINKQDMNAYEYLCEIYVKTGDVNNALKICNEALVFFPEHAFFYYIKANVLKDLNRYVESIQAAERLIQINPDYPEAYSTLITSKLKIADWEGIEPLTTAMLEKANNQLPSSTPFSSLLISDSPQQHRYLAQSFMKRNNYMERQLLPFNIDFQHQSQNRIKIAYVSADFYNHATAILMAELFELHDKNRFEIYAYSYGPNQQDFMRKRLEQAFEHFYEVSNWSDEAIARHINEQQIGIVIDLKGFTTDSRLGIFSLRPAPIQINYLGYPGTLAASFIDYIIADNTLIPKHLEKYYTEKIIRMPDTYQPNDRHRIVAKNKPTRKQVSLPEDSFVFCCFNNPFKILPKTFALWTRILQSVPNSVLWLLKDTPEIEINIKKTAESLGVNRERIIFADRTVFADHMARHDLADLFLDTLPYNAHTTTSDALWAGLPVLTCIGQSFAS